MPVIPHKQRSTTASLTTPSYARSTAASEKRKACTGSSGTSGQVRQRRKPTPHRLSPTCIPPRRGHELRTMRLAGFFDLPGELRNAVYDLSQIGRANRRLDFCSRSLEKQPAKAIPALLRADDRLLLEAGSYYFCAGTFDILLDQRDAVPFLASFAAIGSINQAQLARNACVIFRLVHDTNFCKKEACHSPSDDLKLWRISSDHVFVSSILPQEACRVGARFPEVAHWTLASQCQAAVRTWTLARSKLQPPTRSSEVHPSKLLHERTKTLHPRKLLHPKTQERMRWVVERVYEELALLEQEGSGAGQKRGLI